MSRSFAPDFDSLLKFLADYSLKNKLSIAEFPPMLKRIHRHHLAMLTLLSEIENQAIIDGNIKKKNFRKPFDYFYESVSDIGLASFCFIHGATKPSKIMLRSAIETLIKGIAAHEFPTVLVTKSVFGVIDEAKKTTFFSDPVAKKLLQQLETTYGVLCEDVHTAKLGNMAHISALNSFPSFDSAASNSAADLITETSKKLLSLGCLFYKDYFFGMHFQNREIVVTCIPKNVKKALNGH